jgi:murein DD-endopeptidase MepM/ murein hydrolase activator NlpD
LLNASVGVQRAIGRLRRPPSPRASATTVAVSIVAALELPRRARSLGAALHLTPRHKALRPGWSAAEFDKAAIHPMRLASAHPVRQARSSLLTRVGHDRAVALVTAGILVGASIVSVAAARPAPATGGPTGPGAEVRLSVGGEDHAQGAVVQVEPKDIAVFEQYGAIQELRSTDFVPSAASVAAVNEAAQRRAASAPAAQAGAPEVTGPFLDDGTLLKPVAVNTAVADGRGLMQTYKVKSGDTLISIAKRFGVSMMTVWWANKLESKDDLHLGQVLTIPPVTGLVVTVKASDTLASLAAKHDVEEQAILDANKLTDPNLVVGQVLAIPGALGEAIPVPKASVNRGSSSGGGRSSGSSRAPVTYTGGAFRWPVSGGGNYISQYYHYGHYGIDIAADYGSPVRATAGGRVIFAGWKGNGGGYQVWIAHGSGLYSTYNHMSAISVGSGQNVARGTQVGRIGQSGRATGPHLHFEVWRGGIWSGGSRVNPLAYL